MEFVWHFIIIKSFMFHFVLTTTPFSWYAEKRKWNPNGTISSRSIFSRINNYTFFMVCRKKILMEFVWHFIIIKSFMFHFVLTIIPFSWYVEKRKWNPNGTVSSLSILSLSLSRSIIQRDLDWMASYNNFAYH